MMHTSLQRRWLGPGILLITLLGTGSLGKLQGQEAKAARLDAYGDPLPDGAVKCLGTLRLVHLGRLASVAVSPDGGVACFGCERWVACLRGAV
jgi:hypothetical protein